MTEKRPSRELEKVVHLALDYGVWACGKAQPNERGAFDSALTTCSDCIASGSDWVGEPFTKGSQQAGGSAL